MTTFPILRYPDPRLKQRCAPVESFDPPLRDLAEGLLQTMRAAPGIGMTAAHVGIARRLVVTELDGPLSTRVYVNPEILWQSDERRMHVEGSVSMPGVTEEVERPAGIRLGYRTLDGSAMEEEADGLLSVCLQHEIDQLDGLFWIERLSRLKRERIVRKFRKLGR